MPRVGPACLTCRQKCRKCDRARPDCQRCRSKGLVCGGYPEQFRFCGIASRGKWKGARIPVSSRSSTRTRTGISDAAPETHTSPTQEVTVTACFPSKGDQAPAAITLGSSKSPAQEAPVPGSFHEKHSRPLPELPDDITTLLNSPDTAKLLGHYDEIICPHQIAEVGDDPENPYRAYILPLARKKIGLLYAVLGLAASHLGRMIGDEFLHEATAVEYRMKAIRALSEEIRKSQRTSLLEDEQDTVLAIIQVLLLHDISESGVSSHGIHITGAMSVCKQLLIAEGLHRRRQRAMFFLGNLAWLDIIRAFAGSERMCFSQDIRELVAFASDKKFELVNGCPREVFLVIGGALEKAKEYTLGWLTWDEYQIALLLARHKLYSWNPQGRDYPSPDPLWLAIAEAHQFASILRILWLLDPSKPASSPDIQECVKRILDATALISPDCSLLELLVLPVFMAGADCLSRHSQYYVLTRLHEIERRSEFRNPVPADLLRKVWDARAAQAPDDSANISWTTFTHCPGLARQHDYLII
ncbi:C6 zinc finger domain protein [Aspergillus sclerotioniger CBS 115572]|uniref:C6 zinc finger domain protein n=1 Tax=Aspergillus sclerotioniger CBS 115572 TaxID=1450535 RepID=A0A317WDI7_9EURO|nr:C6 zinc finger domain protein [Aspergillus sclerotioniger CBS 115572]PWY84536.1 C6 zinc finger domain protein [Aspergillus sclerotioniger CBS 115572]